MNDIMQLLNHFLGKFWIVFLLGLLHIVIRERQPLMSLWHRRHLGKSRDPAFNKARPRLIRRLMFVIGGSLMVLSAWTLTICLLRVFVGSNFTLSEPLAQSNAFTPFRDINNYIALLGVAGFITAGTCFTLSAGGRWLVTMGKIFTSLTVVGLGWLMILASLG